VGILAAFLFCRIPSAARFVQLVEQGTENPRVYGLVPTSGATKADLVHPVRAQR